MPTASPFTAGDFDDWIDYEARQFWSSGLRPADRYCHCLNFSADDLCGVGAGEFVGLDEVPGDRDAEGDGADDRGSQVRVVGRDGLGDLRLVAGVVKPSNITVRTISSGRNLGGITQKRHR